MSDKASLSYRAGYDAFLRGADLADDPKQLFENWDEYQVGYIDAMAELLRNVRKNTAK